MAPREEPHNNHKTPGRKTKQSNPPSLLHQRHINLLSSENPLNFNRARVYFLQKEVDMTIKCHNHRPVHGTQKTSEHWKPSKTNVQARIQYISKLVNSLYQSETIAELERTHNSDYKFKPGLEVIELEYGLRLKIKRNDWLLADTCPKAANHCALF